MVFVCCLNNKILHGKKFDEAVTLKCQTAFCLQHCGTQPFADYNEQKGLHVSFEEDSGGVRKESLLGSLS